MACSHFVSGSAKPVHFTGQPHATIALRVDFDAGITILTGASDIGQGSSTIITQVVAEILGVEYRRLRLIATDSALTPKDNGSYSSRVTFMVGNAAADAARNLKRVLVAARRSACRLPKPTSTGSAKRPQSSAMRRATSRSTTSSRKRSSRSAC
ncbi:molybdopterin-dependent oxidoreductase [Azoarcus sp. PA01]|nr:molybdopterin-dependent oxidoreductase [Azoarcus sp. PA01]